MDDTVENRPRLNLGERLRREGVLALRDADVLAEKYDLKQLLNEINAFRRHGLGSMEEIEQKWGGVKAVPCFVLWNPHYDKGRIEYVQGDIDGYFPATDMHAHLLAEHFRGKSGRELVKRLQSGDLLMWPRETHDKGLEKYGYDMARVAIFPNMPDEDYINFMEGKGIRVEWEK